MKTIAIFSTLVLCAASSPAWALQQATVPVDGPLENLHETQQSSSLPVAPEPYSTGTLDGAVLDTEGQPIPEATITLSARGKFEYRTTKSGPDGKFRFVDLPAGQFRLSAVAAGFQSASTLEFAVRLAQNVMAPAISLKVADANSSVTVTASSAQIAEAQVSGQEKQRVLGIFPNFYTSYIWKADPMPTRLKYRLAVRAITDPLTLLIVAGTAGAEQYNGTYPGYGPGIAGYGKRFGAAYGDALTARIIGSAILPSVLHQDPRYFYQGSGTISSRSIHAVGSTFITRGDNGKTQINFSHLLGSLAAGAIANAYHPASSRGLGLTFETFGITTGANAFGNLFREFILRKLEPAVPVFANGKH